VDTREPVTGDTPPIHVFDIPQLIAEGEVGAVPTLPSFLYFANEQDAPGGLRLPWEERPDVVAGVFAREQGALVPGRQVTSAKSWLCHDAVDRTARILPWGAERAEQTCSPVEASTRYLAHLRDAWNHTIAADDDELRFERQDIVLTVPASFDEEARELTVKAARDAGFQQLTLLEEPLAAFYAWIVARRRFLKRYVKDGDLVLICDVGGGTTDFSLIRVQIMGGEVKFERTAIGEHLLLGGDNVDLALARRVMEKLGNPKLSLRQQNALRRQCCAAKEKLFSDGRLKRVPVNILGAGRSVVGGTLSAELTRQEVEEALIDGFLPLTEPGDLPARERRSGLRELGLPYANEPAITKHLAAFLTKSGEWGVGSGEWGAGNQKMEVGESGVGKKAPLPTPHSLLPTPVRPEAILFNGGFFTPAVTRERVVETVASWFRKRGKQWQPKVLSNEAPESAVALGAAYYGHVRKSGGLRVSGGSARAYYVGVQTGERVADGQVRAVCVLPRGTEEGTTLNLEGREFAALANRPVTFTLYSSTTGHDAHGAVVTLNEEEVHRHAPLITTLRYGKKSRRVELEVCLTMSFTEVGTLELWCESLSSDHRWRLQFQLRGAQPEIEDEEDESTTEESQTVISEESLERAESMIRAVFGAPADAPGLDPMRKEDDEAVTPQNLVNKIEAVFGYGKDAWPMIAIRRLCDMLGEVADGRKKGPRHEARWLNLFGFCLRPGFGAPADDWRISQARKIYMAGLTFPRELQCQVEWLVLWRRVAGGLNANQQNELFHRHKMALGVGGKKLNGRLNTQVEREGWRLLASLEHLPSPTREALGKELLIKVKGQPTNQSFLWSLGRLGARIPLYGPLNCVIPAEVAAQWMKSLLRLDELTPDVASAVVQLGARTNDPHRDVDTDARWEAMVKLNEVGLTGALIESLREYVPPGRNDAVRIFGESLPEGLRLVG
ncbi:MAG TPA: Hsp70 family protein, partial [Blastocatellia bacterium]|nr:Hsp70 family protein [Blastocatellia bacterium]